MPHEEENEIVPGQIQTRNSEWLHMNGSQAALLLGCITPEKEVIDKAVLAGSVSLLQDAVKPLAKLRK